MRFRTYLAAALNEATTDQLLGEVEARLSPESRQLAEQVVARVTGVRCPSCGAGPLGSITDAALHVGRCRAAAEDAVDDATAMHRQFERERL